jgi:LysR family glycine cleavage system transcriptional activator
MRSSATLPSLTALRVFEAVGRLMSFRKAGEELLISQSAVSHHIATLENELGTKLFLRKARGIAFTAVGETYFESITRGLAIVADASAQVRGVNHIRVSMLPSFAANWLVPRLAGFHHKFPDIRVAIDPTLQVVDLEAGGADLAIRYGDGQWPACESRLLMSEVLTPVASPALLRQKRPVTSPTDLLKLPLLFVSRPYEWELWAEARGLDLGKAEIIQLQDYNVALQAALDGAGVLMGRLRLMGNRLAEATLVQLFPEPVSARRASYWLVTARGKRRLSAATIKFMEWLSREAKASELFLNLPHAEVAAKRPSKHPSG